MSATTATFYSLEVRSIAGINRTSKRCLYLEVEFETQCMKTGEINPDGSPAWNGTLTFSTSDQSSILKIRVIDTSALRNSCAAYVDVQLSDLLSDYTSGKKPLSLIAPSRSSSALVGSVQLYTKEINKARSATIDVERAEEDARRIGRSANAALPAEVVKSVVEAMDKIVESIDGIVENVHPYLNLAWKATTVLYRIISHQWKSDKKLVELVQVMRSAYELACCADDLHDKATWLEGSVGRLLTHTIKVCHFVKEYTSRNFIERLLRITSGRKMDEYKEEFFGLRQDVDSGVTMHNASTAERMSNKVNDIGLRQHFQFNEQRLQKLKDQLDPIRSEAFDRPRCLSKTRTEYLKQIKDWLFAPTNENILWLNGIAGSGKSTIAASILDYCDRSSRLAAFLFFERGKTDPKSIIRTIAYQLAAFESSIAEHMPSAEELRNVNGLSAENQFEKLFLTPLNDSVGIVKGPIIVILDALDECGSAEQRKEILKLLKSEFGKLPLEVRFLVTSRPENDIMHYLSKQSHILEIKLEPTSVDSRNDVRAYIDSAMREAVMDPIPDGFEWDATMDVLGEAANGLFIWAATAVKLVSGYDDQIKKLTELASSVYPLSGLDQLYATVLEQSGITWNDEGSSERFKAVLGLILFGKKPLSCDEINELLNLEPGKAHLTLQRLHSILSYAPGKPVRLHHASFADYLLSPERSGNQKWFVDSGKQRLTIMYRCFDVMEQLLRFNICNLESSFIRNDEVSDLANRIAETIPSRLLYACRFWAEHLHEIPYSPDLASKLTTFAYNHLPYWLEVLSLTNHFIRVAGRALMDAVLWTASDNSETSSFLWDAYRLVNIFAPPASQSAPHIYLSMFSLLKDESAVSKHYSEMHPTITAHRLGTKPPTTCIKVLQGHRKDVYSVAFSPDGKRVVSGSRDCTIHIWDAESGEIVAGPFKGHKNRVTSVSFSHDGKCIVSGSYDCTVRVWNAESGENVAGPFEGHTISITSVSFSPDGKSVVSGSHDRTIRVWDIKSGKLVTGPFEGHTDWVTSVSYSHDGKCVVSGSRDCTIRVWDAISGKVVAGPFERHTDSVSSVSFSPDGKCIVSGSRDCTIRVWDAVSGKVVAGPLEGHTGSITSVSFSPDSKRVVSGSYDCMILVWDAEGGEIVAGPFEGHTGPVTSVSFSPDGKRAVSGSHDCMILVWDAEIGKVVTGSFEEHKDTVTSVSFSPDGKRVVSGSDDYTIRVWDTDSGNIAVGPFEGHTNSVSSVSFSPDGRRVVSGSYDCTIRVWDTESGKVIGGPFEGHTNWVTSVSSSPDGRRIVSGSHDRTILVWDAESGKVAAGPFEGHTNWVRSVLFSPDGKHVVSGSYDRTILVWDAEIAKVVTEPFEVHTDPVSSVSFSPDGRYIVSGSHDCTILVWNAESGQIVAGPYGGHTDMVTSVAFNHDGTRIVSGSHDRTILVWDVEGGEVVAGPFEGHTKLVNSVSFSPDGRCIVSGSHDCTIRVWDSEGGEAAICLTEGHTDSVTSVLLSPDGNRVVSGSHDCTIWVWDAESGKIVAGPFEGHTDLVTSVSFSPDGKCIVSGSRDCTIRVWDANSGKVVAGPFEGHTDSVSSVSFSPDGKHVVSGSHDSTIRVWDTESGKIVTGPFEEHTGLITSVAFSHDGRRIVSGSYDCTILVWDIENGEAVAGLLRGHTGPVTSVSFSHGGKRIVSGSNDRTILVWDAEGGEVIAGPFEGHTNLVTSFSFSPDKKCVVSGSRDCTTGFWDSRDTSVQFSASSERAITSTTGMVSMHVRMPNNHVGDWAIVKDGWIVGDKAELLAWLPSDLRQTLLPPFCMATFGWQRFTTRLDFTASPLGRNWTRGYKTHQ